jgi:hypothetical protein
MAATPTVFRDIRIGLEGTPGTAVGCPIKVPALEIVIETAGGEGEAFRPAGSKHSTFVTPGGDEMSNLTLGGKLCYNTFPYVMACLGYAAPSTVTTGVYKWTWIPASYSADTFKTYTIQEGPSGSGAQMAYGLFTGFTANFRRNQIEFSGSGIAGAVTDGQALTSITKTVTPKPVIGSQIYVYMATTRTGLDSASPLTDLSGVEIHYTDKYAPWWALNGSLSTFADMVEVVPDVGGRIMTLYNATGYGYRTSMRAGDTKWLRLKAVGAAISGTYTYGMQFDFPLQFTNPGDREDDEGAYALGFNFNMLHDETVNGTSPGAMSVTVTNSIDALG